MATLQTIRKIHQSPGQVLIILLHTHHVRLVGKTPQRKLWSPLLAVILGRASRGHPVAVIPDGFDVAGGLSVCELLLPALFGEQQHVNMWQHWCTSLLGVFPSEQ